MKNLLIIPNYQLYGLDVPVSIQCKKGKRNVYITPTWYLLYRLTVKLTGIERELSHVIKHR